MGYTHYYKNKRAFTDAEWAGLTKDVKKLLANCGVPIAGSSGSGSPTFNHTEIMFNGVDEDAHETAYVGKGASEFEFCKTAQKPYDSVVVAFFKLIRKYDPSVELTSDGGSEVFEDHEQEERLYGDGLTPENQIDMEEKIAPATPNLVAIDRDELEELKAARDQLRRYTTVKASDYVKCPVCGEPDMRREAAAIIFCTNHACTSNGGSNHSAIDRDELEDARKLVCEELRKLLKERSKGEVETWGFVALFMDMINEVEKSKGPK